MALATLSFSQEKICAGCKTEISAEESYKIVLNNFYHPEHFYCSACGQVISGNFYSADDKFYHGSCFKNSVLPRCKLCGKTIETEYVTIDSAAYHTSCYTDSIAPHCSLCGEVIQQQYIEDFWGNPYHSFHLQKDPQCWYCGRFISPQLTGGGARESNDQFICSLCLDESIGSISAAEKLVDQVRSRLESFGINTSEAEIDLRLSSWSDLKKLTRTASVNHTGFTESEVVYYNDEKLQEKFKIHILSNLPVFHFVATAAHELMHVWQHLYGSESNRLQIVEGSCNYAAYLILNTYEDKKARYMIESLRKDESPVYGNGFRFIRDYVAQYGRKNWLSELSIGLKVKPQ